MSFSWCGRADHSATKFYPGVMEQHRWRNCGQRSFRLGRLLAEVSRFVDPDPSYHDISYTRDVGAAAFVCSPDSALARHGRSHVSLQCLSLPQELETLSLRRSIANDMQENCEFQRDILRSETFNYPKLAESPYHALAEKYSLKAWGSYLHLYVNGGEKEAHGLLTAWRFSLT